MVKAEKRKAPEPGTDIPYGNGTIMKVKVSNFMCHKNLEVDLGPRINFIVGENGSGKSAVLTALSVCLGMKKAAKERSDKGMKGFIREGSTQAKVEVSIRNSGQDALEPETYGNVITVERVINSTGAAPFKVRNQWGKDMGSSRDALTRITDHFNIDVDNPIVVMSQDSSRQFLHSGKDSDKYKFFVKATLLEDIQHKIAYIKDLVKQMDAQIAEQEELVPQIEADVKKLTDELESFSAIEDLKAKMQEYRRRLAWGEVYHSELMLQQTTEEGDRYRNEVRPMLDASVGAQAETMGNCQAEVDDANAKITEFNNSIKDLADETTATHDKYTYLLRNQRTKETNLVVHQNDVTEKTNQRAILEEQIATARMTVAQQSQAAGASFVKEIAAATARRDELKRRKAELDAAVGSNRADEANAQNAVRRVEFEVKDTQDRLTGFEQKLREANSGGGDVLGNIGGRNAGPLKKLCDMVQTRASSFSTSPIGPIGMHIKLKDQAWANAVEDHIGQSLGTWLVATMADRNALHGMMRRECGFQGNLPTITVMNLKRAKYAMPREKLPPQGMRTMLGILEIEHDCVFNVLVDFSSVERIVLVPDQGTAVDVVKEHRTVFEAFSKDRRVKQSGPGVTNDRAFHANLNPKLAADQKQLVAALKADIANCKSKVLSLRKDLAAAQAAFESAKNVVVDQRREERVVRNDLAAAEDALADANTAADEQLGDGGVDIGALEADLGPIVLELEGVLKKKGEVLAKEIDAARVASRSAHDEHEALKLRAGDNEPVYERLQHELDVANKTLIEAKSHAAYYEGRRNELAEKIAENDTSVAQLREAITCSMHGAKMLCDRATAETYLDADGRDASVAELGKMYEQVKKRVSKEEQRFGRPMDRVQRELSAQETHLNRLNATLENSRGPCRKLQQGVKTRQRLLKEASVHVQKEVSHRFNTYLGKKGNAGKITVDYNKGLLVLDVKMAGSGSTVKDTRSLSGGERSYSTLALTLSLGEAIESPFRAMDEFDVFMDAVNRKVSMDNLIEFARDDLNCDKQFLFITPQDISAVCAADSDIKVQRMKAARPN